MKEFLHDFFNFAMFLIVMVFIGCLIGTMLIIISTPSAERDFKHHNAFIEICLESELYSREECIQLAGN